MSIFKHFRSKHRLTQNELAALMGSTQGSVSHVEKDRRLLTVPLAKKFKEVASEMGDEYSLDEIFNEPAND